MGNIDGDNDEVPLPSMTLTRIDVDVEGLADFRTLLARELDANLKPGSQGIVNDHSMGVQFGARNVGGNVQAARQKYFESLQTATANLTTYVDTAELLIDVIHRMASNYTNADISSADSSTAIINEFRTALGAARTDRNNALQLQRAQETQRELNRLNAGNQQ